MKIQIIVKVDGREVADVQEQVATSEALEFERQTEKLKDHVGRVVLEVGFQKCADQLRHPCCCGRPMRNHGNRVVTVTTQSGPVAYERTRTSLPRLIGRGGWGLVRCGFGGGRCGVRCRVCGRCG